jgi:hypothetical protein
MRLEPAKWKTMAIIIGLHNLDLADLFLTVVDLNLVGINGGTIRQGRIPWTSLQSLPAHLEQIVANL